MRRRSDRGGALLLVLGITCFMAILVTAVLAFSFTGTKVSRAVAKDRDTVYAATSAIESSIQQARRLAWIGRFGAPCPSTTVAARGVTATVTCESSTDLTEVDRTLRFIARIDGNVRAKADVVVRDSRAGSGEPPVDVVAWNVA